MGNACNMGVNLHVICQFWDGPERSGMYGFAVLEISGFKFRDE